jgi:hypothetical protein
MELRGVSNMLSSSLLSVERLRLAASAGTSSFADVVRRSESRVCISARCLP